VLVAVTDMKPNLLFFVSASPDALHISILGLGHGICSGRFDASHVEQASQYEHFPHVFHDILHFNSHSCSKMGVSMAVLFEVGIGILHGARKDKGKPLILSLVRCRPPNRPLQENPFRYTSLSPQITPDSTVPR